MSLLAPLGLLFGMLALPVLVLYMLRLRRQEVRVSSILLWQNLLRDRQANTPWQKLRRNLLLFIQLLLLALLVLALARPAVPAPVVATGSLVILLDASASMSATDVAPTRFDAAVQEANRLLSTLSDQAALAVIRVDHQPRLLAQVRGSSPVERQAAQQALASTAASPTRADWQTAFTLAAATAANWQAEQTTYVIISDGGLPMQGLPALPGEVRYLPVGSSDHNVAIRALALKQIAPTSLRPELFARVTNYGAQAQRVVFSLYFDDGLISAQELDLPAGGSQSISTADLPAQAGVYRAELSSRSGAVDNLALDDIAYAVYNPHQERRVLVASEEYFAQPAGTNIFLEQILGAFSGIQAYRVSPEAVVESGQGFQIPQAADDPFDLYIFDGVLPTHPETGAVALPGGNLLLINPPANPLLEVQGVFTPTQQVTVADHPLMQGIDWRDIYIARARQIELPAWGEALVRDEAGVLVFAGETGGRRVAVLAFDINDSDLPLKVAFPVLIARLIDYLVPAQGTAAPGGLSPGDPLEILYDPRSTIVEVISPGGIIFSPRLSENGGLFTQTDELGLYKVRFLVPNSGGEMRGEPEVIAVNLFDPSESAIAPAAALQVGRSSLPPAQETAISQRELWRWLAGLGVLVLLVEWWLYHRRQINFRFMRKPGAAP